MTRQEIGQQEVHTALTPRPRPLKAPPALSITTLGTELQELEPLSDVNPTQTTVVSEVVCTRMLMGWQDKADVGNILVRVCKRHKLWKYDGLALYFGNIFSYPCISP